MLQFGDQACLDVARAGGKGASLARMSALGLPVPPGFVVPAECLAAALPDGGSGLRAALPDAARAQAIVARAEPPDGIEAAYRRLGDDPPVAVRSSAAAEDSEAASYAGQQETYLHVRGARAVRDRVRDCWASFFSERALFYRARKGSLDDLGMAVVVQRMVRADVAGVLFTCDPVHRRRDRMVVEAVLGLGEAAVSGAVTPGPLRAQARRHRQARADRAAADRDRAGRERGHRGAAAGDEGGEQKLGEEELRELARIGDDLERRLGGPQDIEWALEGGSIYVLQARPVTA